MEINQLKNFLDEFGDNVIFEYDLKKKNWFNIGGKSKVFYKANNLKELINFLKKMLFLFEQFFETSLLLNRKSAYVSPSLAVAHPPIENDFEMFLATASTSSFISIRTGTPPYSAIV